MLPKSSLLKLIPPGLLATRWAVDGDDLVVDAVGAGKDAVCPDCGVVTAHVHSRYQRTVQDLPAHGRRMVIRVTARRFRCREAQCPRKTFSEPLAGVVDGRYTRRTARSEALVHQIALAVGGRPGQRLTARLCVGGSRDTLLRLIRRRAQPPKGMAEVTAIGIDDWAWRKGATYGTILYDLEGRRVLGLLGVSARYAPFAQGIDVQRRISGRAMRRRDQWPTNFAHFVGFAGSVQSVQAELPESLRKFQGISSSSRDCGWPAASASSVAFKYS